MKNLGHRRNAGKVAGRTREKKENHTTVMM